MSKELNKDILTLVKYGLLKRVSDMKLYHGRARKLYETEEWQVDPRFNNADNSTGNMNINGIPALSTSENKEIAEKFAKERVWAFGGDVPEVHEIASYDENALVYDRNFNFNKLNETEVKEISKAISNLLNFRISVAVPVDFEFRDVASLVFGEINVLHQKHGGLISGEEVLQVYNNLKNNRFNRRINCTHEFVKSLAGAINVKCLMKQNFSKVLSLYANERNNEKRLNFTHNGVNYPLNMNYVAAVLANNHIIGVRSAVWSATLGDNIVACYLFNLNKINTKRAIGERFQEIINNYGAISEFLEKYDLGDKLIEILNAEPEQVMGEVSKTAFGRFFRLPAGVWENFTVGEHTETVLRVFEHSFNDIPENLKPIMKLAIISHDMDKGVYGKLSYFDEYIVDDFLSSLKLDNDLTKIVKFVARDSQACTTNYFVGKDLNAMNVLKRRSSELLQKITKTNPSEELVNGLAKMCVIMQTCDSGAYTTYSVTRDEKTGIFYRNANPNFTKSFEIPKDILGMEHVLKEP